MKLYYWSPFFSNIATEKAVINSIISVIRFSKKKIEPYLLNVIGEWDNQELDQKEFKINKHDLLNFKLIKYLPKFGFLKSRFSYIVVFFFSIFKLHKFLKNKEADYLVIHLMTFIPLFLFLFFNYKTKIILRISGYPKMNFLRRTFWKIVGKKIYMITTPTKSTLNLFIDLKIFDMEKIKYLPEPILNLKEIRKKNLKNKVIKEGAISKNNLISIGRLTRQKNFQFLIKGFKILNKEFPKLNLFILGEGEERKNLETLIKKLNLEDKIFLVGYKKNIYEYLNKAELFVLTSLWEDPGFVLIEAGFSNKVILSSDCPNSPKELFEDDKNGFLFKKNSMPNFLEKFREIQNLDENFLYKKKLNFKKKIKEFTLLNHFKILNSIIFKNEN